MALNLKPYLKSLYESARDAFTFGPMILLRNWFTRDAIGAVTLETSLGRLSFRPKDSDLQVLRQVFVYKEYDLEKFGQFKRIWEAYRKILESGRVPIIIDAGANIGASSIWFATRFPASQVVAIEPDRYNVELCRRNCKMLANVTILEAAIGATAGKCSIVRPAQNSWAVRTERLPDSETEVVTVEQLLESTHPGGVFFIAKIDIEGFESDLFSEEKISWIADPVAIIIELHDWMLPGQYSSVNFQKASQSLSSEIVISGDNLVFVR
jgi:FkbM family methyltransferase